MRGKSLKVIIVAVFLTLFAQAAEMDSFEAEFGVQKPSTPDPLYPYNEAMTHFNDALYTHALFPVAHGWREFAPEPFRVALLNALDNLAMPVRALNALLQLKIKEAFTEVVRFGVNSTVGVLGSADAARDLLGLERTQEDFGQTLGHYGVPGGIPVVLPFFGPSNLRDMIGLGVDTLASPMSYYSSRGANLVGSDSESMVLRASEGLNARSFDYTNYLTLKNSALDLYPALRDAYEQRRNHLIKE